MTRSFPSLRYFDAYATAAYGGASSVYGFENFTQGGGPGMLVAWQMLAASLLATGAAAAWRTARETQTRRYAMRGLGAGIVGGASLFAGLQALVIDGQEVVAPVMLASTGAAAAAMTMLAFVPPVRSRGKKAPQPAPLSIKTAFLQATRVARLRRPAPVRWRPAMAGSLLWNAAIHVGRVIPA